MNQFTSATKSALGSIARSAEVKNGISRCLSALLLLAVIMLAIVILTMIASLAGDSDWIALICIVAIGFLIWKLSRLHKKWEEALSASRRKNSFVTKAVRKQRMSYEKAVEEWGTHEMAEVKRKASIPFWKRALKRIGLFLVIIILATVLINLAVVMGNRGPSSGAATQSQGNGY